MFNTTFLIFLRFFIPSVILEKPFISILLQLYISNPNLSIDYLDINARPIYTKWSFVIIYESTKYSQEKNVKITIES